ncbi:methionyl-tRNA formyltransferase, mitochondrial isoform X3 [Heterodontus francisci]|uniref:methionyl-tRNA formyltransferase, mitochondrial isoform X3 n=1 Tax=Heterodontus francisci TaxID=7792 RepID=UPI00355C16E8
MWSRVSGLAWVAVRTSPRTGPASNRLFCAGNLLDPWDGKSGGRRVRAAPPWRILFFGTDAFAERVLHKLDQSSGILNLHPSLLPRWRGPAPIFHTLIHGDQMTGVTIMQIQPTRFDVGAIVMQQECAVPPRCTADELGTMLAETGAEMLLSTLKNLPEIIENKREQSKEGITFAPKITVAMSWVNWEEQTLEELDQLNRAIGSRIPLRTLWMDKTVKLLDLVDVQKIPVSLAFTQEQLIPGTIHFHKESNMLLVRCKNGWAGFKLVVLKKVLSAADFYNGYLHPYFRGGSIINQNVGRFQTHKPETKTKKKLSKRTGL